MHTKKFNQNVSENTVYRHYSDIVSQEYGMVWIGVYGTLSWIMVNACLHYT